MFRSLRIKIFNWFAAGRLTLTDTTQEYKSMSYTLGGSNGTLSINPNYAASTLPQNNQTMMIKITPANGGTIVQMNAQEYGQGELYIIPDGADFDRELGKIITLNKLKA